MRPNVRDMMRDERVGVEEGGEERRGYGESEGRINGHIREVRAIRMTGRYTARDR